ncbi:MAG: sigma-70 family RNA polymerase sigma factor [Phycisphaerales bacterium]|nr:sigma-70 family RNA polymerase sigma factor [Phycisphaerales bacterium]
MDPAQGTPQPDRPGSKTLLPAVYEELRALASAYFGGRGGSTLQPTAIVHEAYMKLARVGDASRAWESREHFLAVAARAMRQVLINHAEARRAEKRGGRWERVTLAGLDDTPSFGEVEPIDLADALAELEHLDERQCRVVECRFLAGMTIEETAAALSISKRTVELDWRMARAWLRTRLEGEGSLA